MATEQLAACIETENFYLNYLGQSITSPIKNTKKIRNPCHTCQYTQKGLIIRDLPWHVGTKSLVIKGMTSNDNEKWGYASQESAENKHVDWWLTSMTRVFNLCKDIAPRRIYFSRHVLEKRRGFSGKTFRRFDQNIKAFFLTLPIFYPSPKIRYFAKDECILFSFACFYILFIIRCEASIRRRIKLKEC